MNAPESLILWIYIIVYTGVLHVLNYSILAKPWILLYSFAVVCLLINDTCCASIHELNERAAVGRACIHLIFYRARLPPPPLSLPTGARVIRFWWQARHSHYSLPIIIVGYM